VTIQGKVFLDTSYLIALTTHKDNHHKVAVDIAQVIKSKAVRLTPDLYLDSYKLYVDRPDKDWGLTDCSSFEIMRRKRIVQALTADEHFVQAGYQALLLQYTT
jgi:uncharacterized protein